MIEPLPGLPRPEFTLIHIESSPEVPPYIARELLEAGIPGGLIGYEYRPLAEAVFLDGIRGSGLVAVATSGLLGRICVDVATGEIVHIPKVESTAVTHVNGELDLFTRCVSGVIDRFPFYGEDDGEEKFEGVADEIRDIIAAVDGTALVHNGFWDGLCEDVESQSCWVSDNPAPPDFDPRVLSDPGCPLWYDPRSTLPVARVRAALRELCRMGTGDRPECVQWVHGEINGERLNANS